MAKTWKTGNDRAARLAGGRPRPVPWPLRRPRPAIRASHTILSVSFPVRSRPLPLITASCRLLPRHLPRHYRAITAYYRLLPLITAYYRFREKKKSPTNPSDEPAWRRGKIARTPHRRCQPLGRFVRRKCPKSRNGQDARVTGRQDARPTLSGIGRRRKETAPEMCKKSVLY